MNQDFWFILKNSPNPENAQKYVQYATTAKAQGEFAKLYAYGPANARAYDVISEERAAILPTNPELMKNMIFRDEDWWGEHREEMVERFAEWLLE
jgi:putative spermidine/putrescine transport system substrate-binding protein